MARPTTEERLNKLHQMALAQFDRIQSAQRNERLQCLQDRRFYSIAGAQWEGPLGAQFENKPRFEVNKIHLAVIKIINEYRNNRIAVVFTSKEGDEYDELADTCADLFRADEQDSMADEAYDNAFEEAVGGGIGAFRLRTCYENDEDDEDERQRIRIEPIYDADSSVWFDLDAKRQDKADANHAFVLSSMSRAGYEEAYGDSPTSWPKTIHQSEFDWYTPDVVYIAEYYAVEEGRETILTFTDIAGEDETYKQSELDADPELVARLAAIGTRQTGSKRVKRKRVHKYLMSGGRILEDCGIIAGQHIPVVPVYGKRWFVDNVERCMGHVRLAKDPQRLKNMQLSKLGEISAISSVEKPILTPEQIAGHQVMWSEDNLKNYPYLLINPMTDAAGNTQAGGPLAYTRSPAVPPAMAALLGLTEQDMAEILGTNNQAEKMVSNISGKAVEMIQTRIDGQAFIYMSNFGKAKRRGGEIWLSMASDIYVEEGRRMKAVGLQGQMKSIELMKPMLNPETGDIETENDMAGAKFDVAVDIGPSSGSKRQATVRALTGMIAISDDPETKQVLQAMAMLNMEGEGIADVREFFRKKLVRMGVTKPTEQEAAQLAQQLGQQDPQATYLEAAAEQAQAAAAKARADVVATISKAELTRAQTVETLSKVDERQQTQALEVIDRVLPARQQVPTIAPPEPMQPMPMPPMPSEPPVQ
jgi:hypothetical protein